METNTTHPFERTLGPGPYTFVGLFTIQKPSEDCPMGNYHMLPTNVENGGSCAHCGHGITNNYMVRTDAGKVYCVGSECIVLVQMDAVEMSKFKLVKKRHERKLRMEKSKIELDAYIAFLDANETQLKSMKYGRMAGSWHFYYYASAKRMYAALSGQTLSIQTIRKHRKAVETALAENNANVAK